MTRATRIAIFAREPIPGRTKTRLARSIGDDAACALHRAFVLDAIAHARSTGADVELHAADAVHPWLSSIGLPVHVQVEGDLGARMSSALERVDLILGSDAPTLPGALLRAALSSALAHDVVLVPVADGGYAAIAARRDPSFLRDPSIRWSTRSTLADTVRAAHARSLTCALTAPHHDVDELDDLRIVAAHLTLDPTAAPETARVLSAIRGSLARNREF